MIEVKVISLEDNLPQLVDEINRAAWDEDNDMSEYDVESLSAYLGRQDTLFIVCHDVSPDQITLLGTASARIEMKPYDKEFWLYVDEVDVCADQRRKGAGKAIMHKLLEIAHERGCEDLWLGTDPENIAANALYQSLEPDDVAQVVGYTYEMYE